MWIIFIKTYQGPINGGCCFPKGQRIDLPVEIVAQFGKEFWEKCDPPWEADADSVVKAQNAVSEALQQVEVVQAQADKASEIAESFNTKAIEAQDACNEAKVAAEDAVKAAQDNKKDKQLLRKAHELIAVHDRKDFEKMKAFGRQQIALADSGLVKLDLADAKAETDKLKANLKAKTNKAAKAAKTKADKEARLLEEEQEKLEAEEKARLEAEAVAKAEAQEEEARLAAETAEAAEKAAEEEKPRRSLKRNANWKLKSRHAKNLKAMAMKQKQQQKNPPSQSTTKQKEMTTPVDRQMKPQRRRSNYVTK